MQFAAGEQIVRERRQMVPDPYRPTVLVPGSWDGPLDRLPIEGAFIASSSSVAPIDATRRQVLTDKSLYCTDTAVDVQEGDRIRRGGTLPPAFAPAIITWPTGEQIALSREGDIVTALITPNPANQSLPLAQLPFPADHFKPTGIGQFLPLPAASYALVVLDDFLGSTAVGFAAIDTAPYPPGVVRWLAEPIETGDMGGEVYYVNARSAADTNPFTGWQPVVEIPLEMKEG